MTLRRGGFINMLRFFGVSRHVYPQKWLRRFAVICVLLYAFSMLIFPFFDGKGSWAHVQNVWDRWQALNVGVLAFASSVIAFSISKFNAEQQRRRDFQASRAFLPAALSELCAYFKECSVILRKQWAEGGMQRVDKTLLPGVPEAYKPVFQDCIRHAEPAVGEYLSELLTRLQVHEARLRDLATPTVVVGRENLIYYFYRLGELQAMVNHIFDFARNEANFDASALSRDDFENAYRKRMGNYIPLPASSANFFRNGVHAVSLRCHPVMRQ
jgi:hypothetical protein